LYKNLNDVRVNRTGIETRQNIMSEKKCFKCGKAGHFKINCPEDGKFANAVEMSKIPKVEIVVVELEGRKKNVLFDTGAAETFIGLGELKSLGKNPKRLREPKEFLLVDDSKLIIDEVVELGLVYNDVKIIESLNVINKVDSQKINKSNNFVRRFRNSKSLRVKLKNCQYNVKLKQATHRL
jgi:hypothetical protein